jgi:glutamine amidotransferase-like uncharacterized protein
MTKMILSVVAVFFAFSLSSPEDGYARFYTNDRPIALVWGDDGACKEGCVTALADLAEIAGFDTIIVTRKNFSQRLLDSAALWVQPGGDAIDVSKALKSKRLEMIRDFVYNGGSYLGICAGAFLADTWVDDKNTIPGLGITPVVTADYKKKEIGKKEMILDVYWNGIMRKIYFSQGPTIKENSRGMDQIDIFAYYFRNEELAPAAWENSYGDGYVVVSGMHPEALPAWKKRLKQKDTDGDDSDLALELFDRAYKNRQARLWH